MRRVWNCWPWLKWTPVPVFLAILLLGYLVPDDDRLWFIGYVWLAIALASSTFAILLVIKTHRIRCIAVAELPEEDPFRMLMEIQHATTVLTVSVHLLFTAVGLSVVYLPNEEWRQILSRSALMDAQYMLFLVVALTYIAVLLVMRQMRESVNESQIDPKAKEMMDKDLRRGKM